MKTPKRKTPHNEFTPRFYTWEGPNDDAMSAQRWHRKNRIKQLKHTIDKLTFENNIYKETFNQNRAFLKMLLALLREPKRDLVLRAADVDMQLRIKLMSLKEYDRKEPQ